jgi:uncharacterized Zn finger protein (UPF0148 family)
MALLKKGSSYRLNVISSYTYKCSKKECEYCITELAEEYDTDVFCPICSSKLTMISSHSESENSEKTEKDTKDSTEK